MAEVTWLFSLEQLHCTLSRKAGMTLAEENRQRRHAVKIIMDLAQVMKIKVCPTVATASVYFHRFFMHNSMVEFPPSRVALACLFLAGKVEETPKKCKDLLNFAKEKFPVYYGNDSPNDLTDFEKVVLHTLRFDLEVFHPYNKIIEYVNIFEVSKEDKSYLCTTAWTFINDSYCTTLCLLWEPELIAVAVIEMALMMASNTRGLVKRYRDQDTHPLWWEHFIGNLSQKAVDLICHQLLDYYWLVENEDTA